MKGRRSAQRGAALLLAMVILTLVSTLAAGMIWQQSRAIDVEAAERARTQSAWILNGALDWARLILREDGRTGGADDLREPWAVPLAEARLSTFLAADRSNAASAEGIDAFLSGSIEDAQSRYNLRNLVVEKGQDVSQEEFTKRQRNELLILQRLCERAGLPQDLAQRLANALREAWADNPGAAAPLAPKELEHITWLGFDPAFVERLRPWVTLLPRRTQVNLNTASPEVLAAVLGVDGGSVQRLVQARRGKAFKSVPEAAAQLPDVQFDNSAVGVATAFFIVRGRLRLDDRVLEEQSLVERRERLNLVVLQRERVSMHAGVER
jgi:general secretion pathway protein K